MPRIYCCIFWLVALSVPVLAQAPHSTADETKILALENAWNQAQIHHDAKALENVVGDKFIYTDTDGTVMDKARFLADVKDPAYKASLVANEGVKVDLYDNAAVVSGSYHSKGTYKTKPFDHRGRFTDTWIFQNGQWQCVASHTTLLRK
ncbi:MAG: nuclear transport factor 2 family protein [Acidobacteriia bacterium]|nr:nuclear transport factor 2 family protein [Terriglobia bacterium]